MKIKNIAISNFRCFFQPIEMNFDARLTVIIARNGQGKTSFLDAISVALGAFLRPFDLGKTKQFVHSDATYLKSPNMTETEQQYPITVQANLLEPVISILREKTGRNNDTTIKEAHQLIKYAEKLMQQVQEQHNVTLPVVAYYGTSRVWKNHKNKQRETVLSESRTMGYEDCFIPTANFKQLQQWFTKATYAVMQQKEMPEYANYFLPQQVEGIKTAVNDMLTAEGWDNFHYSFSHEELTMSNSQQGLLPVSLLSDGVQAIVALTADLAWRCTKLNPHFKADACKQTLGIVLIDEIDLHLHPAWQQSVLHRLQTVFPKIQFIITTHSPQVISTVDSACIRIVDDNQVYSAPQGTKGAEVSRILKRVFGVETRPQEDENTKLLNQYLDKIYHDQWKLPEVQKMRKKLDAIYGDEEPELMRADLHIENREWELSLEEN